MPRRVTRKTKPPRKPRAPRKVYHLEPCPFCGDQKMLQLRRVFDQPHPIQIDPFTVDYGNHIGYKVQCLRCHAVAKHETRDGAVALWNSRPGLPGPACALCGSSEHTARFGPLENVGWTVKSNMCQIVNCNQCGFELGGLQPRWHFFFKVVRVNAAGIWADRPAEPPPQPPLKWDY